MKYQKYEIDDPESISRFLKDAIANGLGESFKIEKYHAVFFRRVQTSVQT